MACGAGHATRAVRLQLRHHWLGPGGNDVHLFYDRALSDAFVPPSRPQVLRSADVFLQCAASPLWIEAMGVHSLLRGPSQPFYRVLVHGDQSSRYAAEGVPPPCHQQSL